MRLTVDGEEWEVTSRDGQLDLDWLSGIAPGYGFSARPSPAGTVLTEEQVVEMIREFMSNVDPATGYLDER